MTCSIASAKSTAHVDTTTSHQEKDHGQGGAVPQNPHEGMDEIFSIIPEKLMTAFKPITDAYLNEDLERAITETKRLMRQEGEVGEVAAFLLGDLYLKQGGDGNKEAILRSIDALEEAIKKYPATENAAKTVLRQGRFYLDQKRYFAALDHFRLLTQYPRYAASAQVGIAQAFQGMGEWAKVVDAYLQFAMLHPSLEDQKIATFVYADALYQLGQFEEAYRQYKDAASRVPDYYLNNPQSVFQYGESAYRTGAASEAAILYTIFYENHAKGQGAHLPVVLARLANKARIDGAAERTRMLSDAVYNMKRDDPGVREGKIILSTGRLAALSCPDPCSSEKVDQSLKHIEKESSRIFLEAAPPSITTQGAIVDWLIELQRTSHFDIAEEVHLKFLATLPLNSPFRATVESLLIQTILDHFESLEDPKKIVDLYRRFQRPFTPQKMAGKDGLKIANSYLKIGRLSEALHLFRPIAANVQSPESEEALYQVGLLLAQLGSYERAQDVLEEYRDRYPKQHAILTDLGEIYYRQGELQWAINTYQEWLRHNPQDPHRKQIYQKIADTYRAMKDVPNEIKTYQEWIKDIPGGSEHPYMELADAHYQQQQYKEAIESYRLALKFEEKQKNKDWASLRLAASYQALGQKEEREKIVQELRKNAKDPLIKQIASEQSYDLEEDKSTVKE